MNRRPYHAAVACDPHHLRDIGAKGVDFAAWIVRAEADDDVAPERRAFLLQVFDAGLDPAADAVASPGLAESTRRAYGFDLRDFARWLEEAGLDLEQVDTRALAEYTTELGRDRRRLAPTTIVRRLACVRSFLRFALGPGKVPVAALAPSRARRLPEAPKVQEVETLVDAVGGTDPLALRNAALIELVYSCGLRSAEAVALDLRD